MIRLEDEALENMVLSGNSGIAVPVDIFVQTDGESEITVYSCFEDIIRNFSEEYKENLVSAVALNHLDELLYAAVKEIGYLHIPEDMHHLSEFFLDDICKLKKALYEEEIIVISSSSLPAGVDTNLIDEYYLEDVCAFVAIADDRVVAVACENDIGYEDDSVEIFVETHEDYRGKGYGYAVVYALTKYYLSLGKSVRYKCAVNNIASVALANKCGFEKTGERFSYVCYAFDEE